MGRPMRIVYDRFRWGTSYDSPLATFFFPIRVRFADTDQQGHVFFGNYFTYMDEALMAYIDELGFAWETLGEMGLAIYYALRGFDD